MMFWVGRTDEVMVSPICVSVMSLMAAVSQPTSPGPSRSETVGAGEKNPTLSTVKVLPVETILMASPDPTLPSNTRINEITP